MKRNKISHNVILRLPKYLRYLSELKEDNMIRISSGELGQLMGLTASQIRQDFSCFGEFGQQGYGYNVEMLMKAITVILGINRMRSAIVIGVGNLGRALIGKFPLEQYGFVLTGVFDQGEDVVGTEIFGTTVRHVDTLEEYLAQHTTNIAILTLPGEAAVAMTKRLIDGGIQGIWNFTNLDLKPSCPTVIVENIHFSDSLLTLNYYLTQNEQAD